MKFFLRTINRSYCCFYLFNFLKKDIYNIRLVEMVDKLKEAFKKENIS